MRYCRIFSILSTMKTARITQEHKTKYIISHDNRELTATVRGSFFTEGNFPKVGDYVDITESDGDKAVIERVLPRNSVIMRQDVGTDIPQVIVTNVDIIFIVMGLDQDFNLSRLERYILLAKQSNVSPVIILNKCDAVKNITEYVDQVIAIAGTIPVIAISALQNQNMQAMLEYLTVGVTAVLLGSSGAGKSTITNRLLDRDIQRTGQVRSFDGRGKHTTTMRQLFTLSTGAYLIDTPGMRELGVIHDAQESEKVLFSRIDELSQQCKFFNCDHHLSAGCAVLAAVNDGDITDRKIQSYRKIKHEQSLPQTRHRSGGARRRR